MAGERWAEARGRLQLVLGEITVGQNNPVVVVSAADLRHALARADALDGLLRIVRLDRGADKPHAAGMVDGANAEALRATAKAVRDALACIDPATKDT